MRGEAEQLGSLDGGTLGKTQLCITGHRNQLSQSYNSHLTRTKLSEEYLQCRWRGLSWRDPAGDRKTASEHPQAEMQGFTVGFVNSTIYK